MLTGSPSALLTMGLGPWGSPGLLITTGLTVGEEGEVVPAASYPKLYGADNRFFVMAGAEPRFTALGGSDPRFTKVNGQ